jgi:hypothetical protein
MQEGDALDAARDRGGHEHGHFSARRLIAVQGQTLVLLFTVSS